MDHAYTDEVYETIQQSGTDTWPAQTTDDKPDKSFHLLHPYPCKVTEVHDDGFYKCNVDSENTLDVKTVWTNRLMSKDEAEAAAPGTVIHKPEQASAGLPSWLRIRAGTKLFTGSDGGDATTVSICRSRNAYNDFASGGETKCSHKRPGLKIHIVSYVNDYSGDGKTNIPILNVAADDGSWSGYTGSLVSVQPRIPVGTRLQTEPDQNAKAKLWANSTDDYNSGVELADRTTVEVIKQDPSNVQNSTLFVKVLDGKYAGREGWMLDMGLQTLKGTSLILTL